MAIGSLILTRGLGTGTLPGPGSLIVTGYLGGGAVVPPPGPPAPLYINQGPVLGGESTNPEREAEYDDLFEAGEIYATVETAEIMAAATTATMTATVSTSKIASVTTTANVNAKVETDDQ